MPYSAWCCRRLILALPRSERAVGQNTIVDGAASDLEDIVRGRFVELVSLDRAGGDRLDFYEVHFDEAVAKLRMRPAKRIRARTRRTETLAGDPKAANCPSTSNGPREASTNSMTHFFLIQFSGNGFSRRLTA